MFERFTNYARRVIVLSQEEARQLHHNYIGTEHIVLGLLGEHNGLADKVLSELGMSIEGARADVRAKLGPGGNPSSRAIPFTPRAKKTLERALRQALALHHNYIGTEHLLLGLITDTDSVGAKVITQHAGTCCRPHGRARPARRPANSVARRWLRRRATTGGETGEPLNRPPRGGRRPAEAARLAGSRRSDHMT